MTKSISIAALNATTASEVPFEFEFIDSDGSATGIFFSVLGDESVTVKAATEKLLDERRRKDAVAEARARVNNRTNEAVFTPVADDIDFGQRMAAVRLVGWLGIEEEFTPELALELIRSNRDIGAQVVRHSTALENFTRRPAAA